MAASSPTQQSVNPLVAAGLVEHCAEDPAFFVRHVLGFEPWEKQIEVLESVRDHSRTAVRSCHGAGKTAVAGAVVWWYLLTHWDSVVLTSAPTFRQVETLLWREIRSLYARSRYPLCLPPLNTRIDIGPKWFALGFSTDDPEAAQGFHSRRVLLVIDEAAGFPQDVFDSLEGALSGEGSRLLTIGNPTDPTSVLGRESRAAGVNKIQISAFDTPNVAAGKSLIPGLVTQEWVEDKKLRWGETSAMYTAKVLGEFPEQGTDTLIPLAWVERAEMRFDKGMGSTGGARTIGVDVARFGDDETVIALREGNVGRILRRHRNLSTMETTGHVIHAYREAKATQIHVDGVGVGGGVVDRLVELDYPTLDMQAGATASHEEERFLNARAEWHWNLRDLFATDTIVLQPDDELKAQLTSIKYKMDSRGRVVIERKDEMKKRGLPSPDRAEALMLAFANREQPVRNFEVS